MAAGTAGVNIHLAVDPDVEQRNTIGIAVLADSRELPAEAARQHFTDPMFGHGAVGATKLG